ncbi:BREX system ATP-binding protein BrxD [Lujinxingia vulgaris]|uniref:BREX system ATP-binding protein BrxD n=1 Tax=Lujinxingia vulgaris TaxID=2600176 RepID=A0A5C6X506_9DELT|nr:BREX system ATP-binding protein BrxD [Lujinxingia vulgaris]TXD36979.1 BREX system ATP-binding protein BrxD [Lujinxingia vulgaris]
MSLSNADIQHIFQQLRGGTVPLRGLDAFAVGIDRQRNEIQRLLDLAERGEGLVKFLRGGYGCGKTFMSRLAIQEAQRRGFATSFVVVSDNEFHFYKFSEIYQKILAELSTPTCPRAALGDILDRWIGHLEEKLISLGADEDAEDFDERVKAYITEEIARLTQGQAPDDFVRVVQAFFEAKQDGEFAEAGSLLSWLSGSTNVAHSAKSRAKVKGEVGDKAALDYLRGVLALTKEAGYKGLVIVVDEAETILRMRKDVRGKSLNGIRQIVDAAQSYPGLIWIFTGTPEFFDTRRGVAGLEALYDRIQFREDAGFASARQPQLELKPFDHARLREVALRLRELYQRGSGVQVDQRITDTFIDHLVDKVTEGFAGDVGVVPRQFLRAFVDHLDRVDEFEDYNPAEVAGLEMEGLSEEEIEAREGKGRIEDGGDELIAAEDVW